MYSSFNMYLSFNCQEFTGRTAVSGCISYFNTYFRLYVVRILYDSYKTKKLIKYA